MRRPPTLPAYRPWSYSSRVKLTGRMIAEARGRLTNDVTDDAYGEYTSVRGVCTHVLSLTAVR
jgi:hypothetical protein